jgi:hypothetical protein
LANTPKNKSGKPEVPNPSVFREGENEQSAHKKNKSSLLEVFGVTFAALAAVFTYGQYDVATDTEKRTIRAYVSAGPNHVVTFSDNTPIEIRVNVLNHGQTPASRVKTFGAVDILEYPLPEYKNLDGLSHSRSSPLLNNGESVTLGAVSKKIFSAQEISDAVGNNRKRIFVYGTISYFDVFDIKHTTNFCSSVVGSDTLKAISTGDASKKVDIAFEPCETHNEAN